MRSLTIGPSTGLHRTGLKFDPKDTASGAKTPKKADSSNVEFTVKLAESC